MTKWFNTWEEAWQDAINNYIEGENMALQTTAAKPVKGWTKGNLVGFRESKTGEYFIAKFRLDNGDFCSMVYNNPIKLVDINKLVTALGLETFNAADEVTLPEKGDADMMGMDADIMINVKQKGDFLNANGFKSTAQDFNGQF